MAEYITATDVQNRLTVHGYEYAADRDQSGSGVTADEVAAYITPAIQWAGQLVDGAIVAFTQASHARAAGNQWLKDRCLDLATCRALENGGRNVPKAMRRAAHLAMVLLYGGEVEDSGVQIAGVIETQNIPNYHEPRPNTGKSVRGPRVRQLR